MSRFLIAALGMTIVTVAAIKMSLINLTMAPSATVVQEGTALRRIVELAKRKGDNGVFLGQLCNAFQLSPGGFDNRICTGYDDGEKSFTAPFCQGYQINFEKNGRTSSFNSYVEAGTGIVRIFLANYDAQLGYAFLVTGDGNIQKAAQGRKVVRDFWWSPVEITPDQTTTFAREMEYWIDKLKDIEELPDSKH